MSKVKINNLLIKVLSLSVAALISIPLVAISHSAAAAKSLIPFTCVYKGKRIECYCHKEICTFEVKTKVVKRRLRVYCLHKKYRYYRDHSGVSSTGRCKRHTKHRHSVSFRCTKDGADVATHRMTLYCHKKCTYNCGGGMTLK